MVFTDQMLHPRRVVPVPRHLEPPVIKLRPARDNDNDAEREENEPSPSPDADASATAASPAPPPPLPPSPLGVWYLDGCEAFLETVDAVLAHSAASATGTALSKSSEGEDEREREGGSGSGSGDDDLYERIGRLVHTTALPGSFVEARGRRNLNIKAVPPPARGAGRRSTEGLPDSSVSSSMETEQIVHRLQTQAADIAREVSRHMEVWLDLPNGSMQRAHARGESSSLRLLDYPAGVAVPPHTDGSAYTIVYSNGSSSKMMIQSPDDDDLWYELPPASTGTSTDKTSRHRQLFLMLGSHLDQAIPARLEQIGRCDDAFSTILRAPIHRLNASTAPRRALTLHVKADTVWPSALEDLNGSNHKKKSEGILTAGDYHDRDISWDAELFSQYLCAKYVPSVEDVQAHLKLLGSIVEGREDLSNERNSEDDATCSISSSDDNSSSSSSSASSSPSFDGKPARTNMDTTHSAYRLPSVHCTGYWQLQTERYCTFLRVHRKYGREAAGMLPPREIHHVWLCHQLHPLRYKADCRRLLGGRILGHDNRNVCLRGCPKFHELWEVETGKPWPTLSDLRQEVLSDTVITGSTGLAEEMITANLWHNYDGLARLYDELKKEAPGLCACGPKYAISLLENARLDYARFLIASAYASTVDMAVTPSGPVDLVWHTHQTNPRAYHGLIQREFPKAPIDHVPCGALNPPPNSGKEWLEMTDEIWIKLYGHGVNVQGQAIHCCTPGNPRPTGLAFTGDSELSWWFPSSIPRQETEFTSGFPATHQAIVEMTSALSALSLDIDDLMDNVFEPLSVAMQSIVRAHNAEIRTLERGWRYRLLVLLPCLLSVPLVVVVLVLTMRNTEVFPLVMSLTVFFAFCVMAVPCVVASDFRQRYEAAFWPKIEALVVAFIPQTMERGIEMAFQPEQLGPVDPAHPNYDRYKGKAIVFSRRNESNVEEPTPVQASNEDDESEAPTAESNVEEPTPVQASNEDEESDPPTATYAEQRAEEGIISCSPSWLDDFKNI